ncbi:MAG TPA: PspC domain-containing protein [Vicinamibacterales bacterium]|jgi:phage shock protein PspC (stress-responsive transcriptional regulator)
MQRVIAINLNGNAYQVDENGYAALVAYLEEAERKLSSNPDRVEILADLEQAIGEKCLRFLGPSKNVVTTTEVEQIIAEMGPVEHPADGPSSADKASAGPKQGAPRCKAPRRLYLIHEGAMLAGVCTGLAAFAGIDVTIVRIVFLVLVVITKGFWALVYGALMFVIPSANTSEERAAAHGEPFNAQELIDRAKQSYADLRDSSKSKWNQWTKDQRAQRRWERRQRRHQFGAPWWYGTPGSMSVGPMGPVGPVGYVARVGAGIMIPVLSLASALVFWLLVYTVISLVMSREAFGRPLPFNVPLWVGLLAACIAYNVVAWPLHATRRASYVAVGGYNHGMLAAWDGLLSLGFGILIIWAAYHFIPEVRDLVNALPGFWEVLRTTWDR